MKMEPAHKTLTVPNGVLKKHHQQQQQQAAVYRECLKNHAASLGGHSLDGCGEFMASPSSNPSDPTSLTCAACGCHRNFHRRLHHSPPRSQPPPPPPPQHDSDHEDEDDVGADHGETSSAPHMLMALSAAVGTTAVIQEQDLNQSQPQQEQGGSSRKRFRTKFSTEQKEGMLELSERLGWRMQKRDEGLVEERCREIGVGRGVFKVWMHNNKHNFVPSPRSAAATPAPPPPSANNSLAVPTVSDAGGIIGGGNARVNGPGSAMDTS